MEEKAKKRMTGKPREESRMKDDRKAGREGRMKDDRKAGRRKHNERMKGKAKQGGKGSTSTIRGKQGGDGRMKDQV
jgi:hypothetical protein